MAVTLQDMIIDDPIYGRVVFDAQEDALLISLVSSPAFQRLQLVLQHGISAVAGNNLCGPNAVTRFAHSVGACLLVRRLGATMEAQASALLHDVAHTSLSHTVDYAFNRVVHEEDKLHYLYAHTDIPSILSAHGLDPNRVLEETNFPLLERDAPTLCADRLDYGLRDSFAFGILTSSEVQEILDDITAYQEEIVCTSVKSARKLSDAYMQADRFAWSNCTHAVLYKYAAEAIKEAYQLGQITLDDLWTTCEAFWQSLLDSPHPSVRTLARRVRSDIVVKELAPEAVPLRDAQVEELELKPRTLDPTVLIDGCPRRLSEADPEYAQAVADYRASKKGRRRFEVRFTGVKGEVERA